jgi:hypothetical protein
LAFFPANAGMARQGLVVMCLVWSALRGIIMVSKSDDAVEGSAVAGGGEGEGGGGKFIQGLTP